MDFYKVTNQYFFKIWKKVCKEDEENLFKIFDSKSDYTNFILKKDNCIIDKIAEELKLKIYKEYYHTDAVFYEQKDIFVSKSKYNTWGTREDFCLKQIKIAFEHENNFQTAYQEVIHLLTTNADKKILVTYAKKENTKNHAEDFCKIIEGIKNNEPKILVIFGSIIKDEKKLEWKCYELRKNGPKEIFV